MQNHFRRLYGENDYSEYLLLSFIDDEFKEHNIPIIILRTREYLGSIEDRDIAPPFSKFVNFKIQEMHLSRLSAWEFHAITDPNFTLRGVEKYFSVVRNLSNIQTILNIYLNLFPHKKKTVINGNKNT